MRADLKTPESDAASEEGFVLALGADETRRQAWACAGVCGFILVALLASVLSGTA
jgi:hypothetical protein